MPTPAQFAALVESFDWDQWNRRLRTTLDRGIRVVAVDAATQAANLYDLEFDADDPFVDQHFTRYVGERIVQLDATTHERVVDALRSALADGEGESMTALAARLAEAASGSEAFAPSRALMIARTESAIAHNTGGLLTYRQNAIAHVEVSDGDDDDECAAADGQIWTVDEAMSDPVAHPNCTRAFSPVVEDDQGEE